MKVEITVSASDDIADSRRFYENQQRGLGAYFEASIMSEIRSLLIQAGVHEVHFDVYYRKIARRFPHAIFYRIEGEIVRVYAVLDTRRNPDMISDRLN